MYIDHSNNFKFQTSISLETYQNKEEAIKCLNSNDAKSIGRNKMAFKRQFVTISEFLYLATTGHALCNLFKYDPSKKCRIKDSKGNEYKIYPEYRQGPNKGGMKLAIKADKFAEGSQTIFIDVDYTRFQEVGDYINTLSIKPTCVYMSFSDKKVKNGKFSRRFRMVYIFDKVLTPQEFLHVATVINDQIVFDTQEAMDDDCGKRLSQYMNGVTNNPEVYQTNCIYSIEDFPPEEIEDLIPNNNLVNTGIVFDERMVYEMGNYSYWDFMHRNSWRGYKYRTEKDEWIDGRYQLTDENHLQLWYYREKLVDGQKRRRTLFKNACLRRLMYPNMDPDTALFNLYVDFCRFIDNRDGAVTPETLMRKVRHAFEKTPDQLMAYCAKEIEYWNKNRPKFIVKNYRGMKNPIALINRIQASIRYKEIDIIYDPSLSLQENLERGINIPKSTLYRYCQVRGIDPNPNRPITEKEKRQEARNLKSQQIERFRELYNSELSERENKKLLEQSNLFLSTGCINKWKKLYINNEPKNVQEISWPKFSVEIPSFNLQFKSEEQNPVPEPIEDEIREEETLKYVWTWTPPVLEWQLQA